MSLSLQQFGIDQLTVKERLELIEQLWDSLPEQVSPEEIPEWHREVLAERLAEADANPGVGTPWREALAKYGDQK